MNDCLEMELLTASLPVDLLGTVSKERLKTILQDGRLDWSRVIEMAGVHGMLPMLTNALAAVGDEGVSPAVRDALVKRNRRHVKTVLCAVSALVELQGYFHRLGVQAVSWKGPSLAVDLYGRAALRESTDLDLLVEEQNIACCIDVLTFLGYTKHEKVPCSRYDGILARFDREYCFHRTADGTYVELHTQILPSRFASWQDLKHSLGRTQDTPLVGSVVVETLEPGDLLVSLCAHAIKHHWEKLKWLADIARFMEVYRDKLNWHDLTRWARYRRRYGAILHSCTAASLVFGVSLPKMLVAACEEEQEAIRSGTRVAAWIRSGATAELEAFSQSALLCQSRLNYLSYTFRRMIEPQLADFRNERTYFPWLAKLSRMRRERTFGNASPKTALSVRTVR
jgi:hypothetical protein